MSCWKRTETVKEIGEGKGGRSASKGSQELGLNWRDNLWAQVEETNNFSIFFFFHSISFYFNYSDYSHELISCSSE